MNRVLGGAPAVAAFLVVFVVSGMGGSTEGLADHCQLPDNGSGTADLPPAGCGYVSPGHFHVMMR